MSNTKAFATEFVSFLNKAVSPYHAVEECASLLKAAGFKELKEAEQWKLSPLNKYYMTRNRSTIIAFAVGGKFKPGNGMSIVAAHTDSPCLRVKPVSKISSADCLQVGVSTYGGGLWRTWFDRDLTVAGRVIVKENHKPAQSLLIHIKHPIMSIPNLAIHLDRDSNDKFCFNKEDHLRPILATQVAKALKGGNSDDEKSKNSEQQDHHSVFLEKIAEELNVEAENILDFDLSVIDTQPAVIGGINEEFIYGPRLDNLVNTFSSIVGLIQSCSINESLANDSCLRIAACYDNEECGSESAQGAASALTEWILRRLQNPCTYNDKPDSTLSVEGFFERAIAKSLMISADQAHALHPNYKSKHEENHGPKFHKGVVVKININQRYATTTLTHSILQTVAKEADVPLQ
uniref:Aspartyl aminopeptidase n=1 Tax=Romanomermis culicivorax TaxID=13658 RepID=A0A915JQT7_ROMCU